MCEPMETAQSHGDDTHAVGARPKWAREHGLQRVWSLVSVGCEPGPSIGAPTRTWAKVNVRPQSLVWKQTGRNQKQRQRQNNTRQEMSHGQGQTRLRNTGVRASSLVGLPQVFTVAFRPV